MSRHLRELFDLSGRKALITGGSRGLGLQVAEALGEAGASVMLTSRKSEDLAEASAHLKARGIESRWIAGNASDPEEVNRICGATLEQLGRVDILVNNAGATWGAPAEDYPLEAWDKVMNLNLRSVFLFSQFLAKRDMIPRGSGRIIMMASITGFFGNAEGPEMVAYNTSKAGVINLTRALAGEWGVHGITVNAIAPGIIASPAVDAVLSKEKIAALVPMKRAGRPEEVAELTAFLASDRAAYISGQVISINGGIA